MQLAVANIEVHDAEIFAVGAGIGHQGLAAGVRDLGRSGHAVVGVAAEDRVDTSDDGGHLQIHVHAVVRDDHHQIGLFRLAHLVDHLLHVGIADAEGPVRDESLRVGDRRIGKGLADDGDPHAVEVLHDIGLEGMTGVFVEAAEIGELIVEHGVFFDPHVLADIVAVEGLDVLQNLFIQVGELPVPGHHVHAQQITGADHVHTAGLEGGAGTLPGIAAVEQQGLAGAVFATQFVDQGLEVGEAADLAVFFRRAGEIQIGIGVRLDAALGNAEVLEQVVPDQVGCLAQSAADAEIDVRLTKIDRHQLGVSVGNVQQAHIAELRYGKQIAGCLGTGKGRARHDAGRACQAQGAEEFSSGKCHGVVSYGLSGAAAAAERRTRCWPMAC